MLERAVRSAKRQLHRSTPALVIGIGKETKQVTQKNKPMVARWCSILAHCFRRTPTMSKEEHTTGHE